MLNRGEAAGFSTISGVSSYSVYASIFETPLASYRDKLLMLGVTCHIVDFLPWRADES